MFFQHVYDKTLAQGSYMIGCQVKGEAMVIDAQRDIDVYLKIAQENNLRVTHIAETHIHADFLCGSRELAAATGAKIYLSDEGGEGWQYEFPHIGLKDGDTIKIGNLTFDIWHTPGHTPESISFLLTDHAASDYPTMMFTGDFVFVGDVGRPDLLEVAAGIKGTKEVGAKQMYESIQRFAKLPEYVQVWPGHGAGSACGKALGAVPNSTVGYEKRRNWAFNFEDNEKEFIDNLLAGQPEPPKYFAMMKHLNKVDRPLLVEVPEHPRLNKEQFLKAYKDGLKIIDARSKEDFAKGFIPSSISVVGSKSFSTWAGWVVDYQEQILLVATEEQLDDLTRKLMRIGLDKIIGYITPSDIVDFGIELQTGTNISAEEVKSKIGNKDVQIVDVRNTSEFSENRIEGADHVFIGTLVNNLDKIDPKKETIVLCQSGIRTTVAYSLLRRNGFDNVKTYFGGMEDWLAKGNKVLKGV